MEEDQGYIPTSEKWRLLAACRGTKVTTFFPPADAAAYGIRVCRTCPVRIACTEYAMKNNIQYGIWGGYGERTRRRRRAELKLLSSPPSLPSPSSPIQLDIVVQVG